MLAVVLAGGVTAVVTAGLVHDRTELRWGADIVVFTAIIEPGLGQAAELEIQAMCPNLAGWFDVKM